MRTGCRTAPLQIHHSCNNLRFLAFLVGPKVQLAGQKVDHLGGPMVDRKVDPMEDRWEGLMEGRLVDRRVGLKADHSGGHLEGLKADRWEVRKVDHSVVLMEAHLVDPKVGRSVDLMEVQKGRAVTKVALLLSERLVLLGQVQVVQLVVKEEAMGQARIEPE